MVTVSPYLRKEDWYQICDLRATALRNNKEERLKHKEERSK